MLIRDCIDRFFWESQEAVPCLPAWSCIVQTNNVHGFENKNDFIRQPLKQEADLLEIDLISAFQKLYFILGHWGPQSFSCIDGSVSEKQREISVVFTDA